MTTKYFVAVPKGMCHLFFNSKIQNLVLNCCVVGLEGELRLHLIIVYQEVLFLVQASKIAMLHFREICLEKPLSGA